MANTQPLTDYEQLVYQQPTFYQKLLDAIKQAGQYPSAAAMRAEYMQNPDLLPSAIESNVAKRVQTTTGTIQDILNRATGGLEADVALAKLRREGQTAGTATERSYQRYLSSLKSLVEGGATVDDVVGLYSGVLELPDILNTYDEYSPHGPHKEPMQDILAMTAEPDIPASLYQAYPELLGLGKRAGATRLQDLLTQEQTDYQNAVQTWKTWVLSQSNPIKALESVPTDYYDEVAQAVISQQPSKSIWSRLPFIE